MTPGSRDGMMLFPVEIHEEGPKDQHGVYYLILV